MRVREQIQVLVQDEQGQSEPPESPTPPARGSHPFLRHVRNHLYKWLLGLGAAAGVIANFRTAYDTIVLLLRLAMDLIRHFLTMPH